ncbi:MAG: hypothetical protein QNL91_18530 [Candidatus Krumholzibacteria bacterium]|nr:hypothetical protein [Candidatus Krumholzibacteria bacterium]
MGAQSHCRRAGNAFAVIDWAGQVWPTDGHAVVPTGPVDVYAQVFKTGVTDAVGQGALLGAAWVDVTVIFTDATDASDFEVVGDQNSNPPQMGLEEAGSSEEEPKSRLGRAAARCWALLLTRIYECLPLQCPNCG